MQIIVAADKHWAIGKDGDLLWHLPEDMKFFREKTPGNVVVMGRKTLDSFPGGKPLKNRVNLVLSRDEGFSREGAEIVHSMEEAIELSKKVAAKVAEIYHLPVFLYEKSATASHRENLASVRKGEFEGMAEKIKLPEWQPDFGPAERHPTAGTVAIGARMPLVAYNINLSTDNLEIATKIAKNIRHINGGLRYVKAMGVELKERNITQVSINMTDYTRTALYRAFELVRIEARRYGVTIVGSEIIGLVPMEALIDTASYYLGLENFSMQQVLEARIME